MFRGVFDALNDRLAQPESEQTAFFEDGSRRVLPSFFELLLHLDRTGREFTIVFRTFGTDITDVIEEVNLFATGQHPSYPGVQLSGQGRTDLRIKLPDQTGAFLRCAAAWPMARRRQRVTRRPLRVHRRGCGRVPPSTNQQTSRLNHGQAAEV